MTATEILKRQRHMALTLIGRIIDRNHHDGSVRTDPRKDNKAVICPVAFPAWRAIQESPFSISNSRMPKDGKQSVVEQAQVNINRFNRPADKVRRDSFATSFELSLMKETQAGDRNERTAAAWWTSGAKANAALGSS